MWWKECPNKDLFSSLKNNIKTGSVFSGWRDFVSSSFGIHLIHHHLQAVPSIVNVILRRFLSALPPFELRKYFSISAVYLVVKENVIFAGDNNLILRLVPVGGR